MSLSRVREPGLVFSVYDHGAPKSVPIASECGVYMLLVVILVCVCVFVCLCVSVCVCARGGCKILLLYIVCVSAECG